MYKQTHNGCLFQYIRYGIRLLFIHNLSIFMENRAKLALPLINFKSPLILMVNYSPVAHFNVFGLQFEKQVSTFFANLMQYVNAIRTKNNRQT